MSKDLAGKKVEVLSGPQQGFIGKAMELRATSTGPKWVVNFGGAAAEGLIQEELLRVVGSAKEFSRKSMMSVDSTEI